MFFNKGKQKQEHKKQIVDKKMYLTNDEIIFLLKNIFRKHIGSENPISKLSLFRKIYGEPSSYDPYELWYNWGKVKQAMNWLRRTTKFFIVSRQNPEHQSIWEYFIVTNQADADAYKGILRGTKTKIDSMLKRCDEAIEKKYYLEIQKGKE